MSVEYQSPDISLQVKFANLLDDDELETHEIRTVSLSNDQAKLVNSAMLTRKEQKMLDREIPWREIVEQGHAYVRKFVDAARNEHDSWMNYSSVRPLDRREALRILQDKILWKRCLRARGCYRDKNGRRGEPAAKCRTVAIGCGNPDLKSLRRDAPTPGRLSEFIILQIETSGKNDLFNNRTDVWILPAADAKTTSLQGSQKKAERTGPLNTFPPRDPSLEQASVFPTELGEIIGDKYGTANVPRIRSSVFIDPAIDDGFTQHSLDKMSFYYYDGDRLPCVMIVSVDDFLRTRSVDSNRDIVKDLFDLGSFEFGNDGETRFTGKEINTHRIDGKFKTHVTQREFTRALAQQKFQDDEHTEFHSRSGSLPACRANKARRRHVNFSGKSR